MSAEADFRAAVLLHAPLTALIGNRLALHAIDEGAALPYIVFDAKHAPEYTLNNTLVCDFVTISAHCWAATATQAQQVRDALTAAVRSAGAIVLGSEGMYDPELGLDAEKVLVEWLD